MANIDYLSASALTSYMSNQYAFYKDYVLRDRDYTESVSTAVGSAMHLILESKLKKSGRPLDQIILLCIKPLNLTDQAKAKKLILKLDEYISTPNTVLQTVISDILKSNSFEVEKNFITPIKAGIYNTHIKGYIDVVYEEKDGVTIIDWKSVTKFNTKPKASYIIQGLLYTLPYLKEGKKIKSIKFVEIKKSKNADGSDICNIVELDLSKYEDDMKWILFCIESCLEDVRFKRLWLPNPNDFFDQDPLDTIQKAYKRFKA